jgi:hypothetical protein
LIKPSDERLDTELELPIQIPRTLNPIQPTLPEEQPTECDLVVKPSDGSVSDDKKHSYAPINNILDNLFQSITIELNERFNI